MQEPLEAYLEAFEQYRSAAENLLELTVDLTELAAHAVEVLTDDDLLLAVRYLAGPPISEDDLTVLADAKLSRAALKSDSDAAQRIIAIILMGLDRNRFPWVAEMRDPTEEERRAATLASAALMASRRVATVRANDAKTEQETQVKSELRAAGLAEVPPRTILTTDSAPARGEFCGESLFGLRKADIVVRLYDGRLMPIECKVSNSELNSIKRLNNDAAAKARSWTQEFGTSQTVPVAVLSGVFKVRHLEQAQDQGLTLFWAHSLGEMVSFVRAAVP
jgi:hypothetical protein